jgi:hypothetical protein
MLVSPLKTAEVDDMPNERIARLEERVDNHVRFFWTAIGVGAIWLGWISVQIIGIKGNVKPFVADQIATELKLAAADPTKAESQTVVQRVIANARKTGTPIPSDVLTGVGKSFVAVSARNAGAWETVTALMQYRTNLNGLTFVRPPTTRRPDTTQYMMHDVSGKPLPEVSFMEQGIPIGQAARLQELDKPTNPRVEYGPTQLLAVGGAIQLDQMEIAHVIFVGVEIHYSGGLTRLQDLQLVNCTFVFDSDALNGRLLAEQIISSKTVDFQSS